MYCTKVQKIPTTIRYPKIRHIPSWGYRARRICRSYPQHKIREFVIIYTFIAPAGNRMYMLGGACGRRGGLTVAQYVYAYDMVALVPSPEVFEHVYVYSCNIRLALLLYFFQLCAIEVCVSYWSCVCVYTFVGICIFTYILCVYPYYVHYQLMINYYTILYLSLPFSGAGSCRTTVHK